MTYLRPRDGPCDLFDPQALLEAVRDVNAIAHLATRIRPLELIRQPEEWIENDRLRAEASRLLVDAALLTNVEVYVQPTVTFLYPRHVPVDEETRIGEVHETLRSARGVYVSVDETMPRFTQTDLEDLVRLAAGGSLKPVIDRTYPWTGSPTRMRTSTRGINAAMSSSSCRPNLRTARPRQDR